MSEPATGWVIAVDIGGTTISAGAVGPDGICCTSSLPTPSREGPSSVLAAVASIVAGVRERCPGEPAGVGIATAGVVDTANGRIVAATDHIRDWAGTPVGAETARATGLPTRVVNDVHAHLLGEVHHGAVRGASDVLLVAAGTGLGGALMIGGRLVTGPHGTAGHLGHVPSADAAGLRCACGRRGHLESVASGGGIAQQYARLGGPVVDGAAVVAAAADGDERARRCIATAAAALGAAIGGWVNLLDPDVVVITGGLLHAGRSWWDGLIAAAAGHTLPALAGVPIVPAEHPDASALLGAASLISASTSS